MSRWPAIVVVSTVAPAGQRLDPREVNDVVAPGVTSTPPRAASQASTRASVSTASGDGSSASWFPIRHTSCEWPWLPPVASPITGASRLPARPSHARPNRSTNTLYATSGQPFSGPECSAWNWRICPTTSASP
jgi:hypothetical protein